MQPGEDREEGGGKEREIRLTFVHSGGREGRKDDRKGDGVADSAQKVSEVLDRLGLSNPILGLPQAIADPIPCSL